MITRRRFITITAGTLAVTSLGARAAQPVSRWQGIALGANAEILLDHPDAPRLLARAVAEIRRLEGIFSLYDANSQLSRLNRDGRLPDPAFEMVELLSICSGLNTRTGGAFDPTVQALWQTYARAYTGGGAPDAAQIRAALKHTGWRHVRYDSGAVRVTRAGVALTLNGIGQGYIADRIAAMFRAEGVENVLVDTGEIAALGHPPDGDSWTIRLGSGDGQPLALSNAAVATSAPLGTTFDAVGRVGHILDPRTGQAGAKWSRVSVVAATAAEADGLSTAFCLMGRDDIAAAQGATQVYLA